MFFIRRPGAVGAEPADSTTPCPHRRRLLKGMAGVATLAAMPDMAHALSRSGSNARTLAFKHLHTGEHLSLVYRIGDSYVPEGLSRLSRLMRDFRTGDVHPIDPALLDTLWQVQANLRTSSPFDIISAYRSPKTNTMLRSRSAHTGVAKDSMHLHGRAIDIRLPGVALADVRDAAVDLKRGGVGYYADSGFVHLDTGRVRRW